MPELPEVETIVRTLKPRLAHSVIVAVDWVRPDIVTPSGLNLIPLLMGRTIRVIDRRGKRIIITLDDGNRLYFHMGMTGHLTIEKAGSLVQKHTHAIVTCRPSLDVDNQDIFQLRFRDPRRFGGIWWLGDVEGEEEMGPEPLTMRAGELAKRLAGTKRAIKTALLDQWIVAGIGNIYADEALFMAGIHPEVAANRLSREEIGMLSRAIKAVLKRAIEHRGSTIRDYHDASGAAGEFQAMHQVYGREGLRCRKCKGEIERIVLGGRSTHFCGKCQKRN